MKYKKCAFLLSLVVLLTFTAIGCGKTKLEGELNGKWYYIHDTEHVGLNIRSNGTALLDGEKYACDYDKDKISLTDKSGQTAEYRYSVEGEGQMYLYKPATYKYTGTNPQNGIVGTWVDTQNGKSSFEFTEDGTFREDSYIPGYYLVNEEEGSILLVYNDHYVDTTIYFSIQGDTLFVDYPWPMVKEIEK